MESNTMTRTTSPSALTLYRGMMRNCACLAFSAKSSTYRKTIWTTQTKSPLSSILMLNFHIFFFFITTPTPSLPEVPYENLFYMFNPTCGLLLTPCNTFITLTFLLQNEFEMNCLYYNIKMWNSAKCKNCPPLIGDQMCLENHFSFRLI